MGDFWGKMEEGEGVYCRGGITPFLPRQIATSDIDMSREWLKRTQTDNCCFLSKGKVFNKAMKVRRR